MDFSDHARLGWHDTARLAADLAHAGGGAIAEVGMDPGTGEWFFKGLRPDKDKPNALHTVLSTLLELAENIEATELEARLLAASHDPLGDRWEGDRAAQAEELLRAQHALAAEARQQQKQRKKAQQQQQQQQQEEEHGSLNWYRQLNLSASPGQLNLSASPGLASIRTGSRGPEWASASSRSLRSSATEGGRRARGRARGRSPQRGGWGRRGRRVA